MEIRIGKSAHACLACDRPFVHEEGLTSLVRAEGQVLRREDYCGGCWAPERGANAYSVWSSRYVDPQIANQTPPELFSPLRQIFYETVDGGDRTALATAYLAAQLLRRQKVFRLIKESEMAGEDTRVALFSDRITNRLIEVRDPDLSHEELEAGRRCVTDRLNQLEAANKTGEEADHGQPEQT